MGLVLVVGCSAAGADDNKYWNAGRKEAMPASIDRKCCNAIATDTHSSAELTKETFLKMDHKNCASLNELVSSSSPGSCVCITALWIPLLRLQDVDGVRCGRFYRFYFYLFWCRCCLLLLLLPFLILFTGFLFSRHLLWEWWRHENNNNFCGKWCTADCLRLSTRRRRR